MHDRGEEKAIPVICSVYWQGMLWNPGAPNRWQAVKGPHWHDLDTALNDVTKGILKVVKQLTAYHATALPVVAGRNAASTCKAHSFTHHTAAKEQASLLLPLPSKYFNLTSHSHRPCSPSWSVAISPDGESWSVEAWIIRSRCGGHKKATTPPWKAGDVIGA